MQIVLKELVAIGRILKSSGRLGELYVAIDDPFHSVLKNLKYFILSIEGDAVPFFISSLESHQEGWAVKLEEVVNPQDARPLLNQIIYVRPEDVAHIQSKKTDPLALIGWSILASKTKLFVGSITEIQEFPGQLMLIITTGSSDIKMIPLVEDWITKVVERKKELYMDLPEGLLNLDEG